MEMTTPALTNKITDTLLAKKENPQSLKKNQITNQHVDRISVKLDNNTVVGIQDLTRKQISKNS